MYFANIFNAAFHEQQNSRRKNAFKFKSNDGRIAINSIAGTEPFTIYPIALLECNYRNG